MPAPAPTILDGTQLAGARAAGQYTRAADLTRRLGRPPCLALVAFAAPGASPPWLDRKRRAAAAAGIVARTFALAPEHAPQALARVLRELAAAPAVDGIFVQDPLPGGPATRAALAALPPERDVDAMAPEAVRRFAAGTGPPPATVDAALALLDAHDVGIAGCSMRVAGRAGPLARAFEITFGRRGARPLPHVPADAADLARQCAGAEVLIALAERPGAIRSEWLAPGAIAIDGGYFNAGGRGDIDTSGGIAHLGALVPVPGGLGPMTVSILIDRTLAAAAR